MINGNNDDLMENAYGLAVNLLLSWSCARPTGPEPYKIPRKHAWVKLESLVESHLHDSSEENHGASLKHF